MRLEEVDLLVVVDHTDARPSFVPRESRIRVVAAVENHIVYGHIEPRILTVITVDEVIRSLERVTILSEDVYLSKAQASRVFNEIHHSALVPGPVPAVVGLQLQVPHVTRWRLVDGN